MFPAPPLADDGFLDDDDEDNNNNNNVLHPPVHPIGFRGIAADLYELRRQQRDIGVVQAVGGGSLSTTATVRFSIANARNHYKKREFAESVLNYVAVLKILPHASVSSDASRRKFLNEFLDALRAYLRHENDDNRADQVLQIVQSIFPAESAFFRAVAEHLFERGKLLSCIEMFGRAMDCARDELEWLHAASSKENARSNLFDAWHWRMLNDARRNALLKQAILAALDYQKSINGQPPRFLDIGCGSGILSIFAAQSPSNAKCTACELDEVMRAVARRCFECNGTRAQRIALFECDSRKLELEKRCNVLVTETLDCAVFGERIVETILDAHERLLTEDAIVIPNKAVILFSLLECATLAEEHAFESRTSPSAALLSSCCYIRDSSSRPYNSIHNTHAKQQRPVLPPSPYSCAYLKELSATEPDHPAYRLLSKPTEGLLVDFTNVQQLRQINSDHLVTEVNLKATEEGMASAVCVWFRLHLYGDIEICTSPEEEFCWQQALFPFYPPAHVSVGDELHFEVFVKDHALHVQPISRNHILSTPFPNHSQMPLPRELLRAPSALDLSSMHDPAIAHFFVRALHSHKVLQALDCTDLLLPLDEASNGSICKGQQKLPNVASTQPAIRYICRQEAANLDKAVCHPGSAILFWPFSQFGSGLRDDYFTSIIDLHFRSPGTILLPSKIILMGCLISSEELCLRSGLDPSVEAQFTTYCGADLSPMGEYRITHFQELEHRTLQYTALSNPVEMFRLEFTEDAHADLAQLTKLKHEAHFACTRPGCCDAILLWFAADASKCAGTEETNLRLDLLRDTRNAKSFAFLLPKPIFLTDSDNSGVKAQFSLHHGNVLFHWVKETFFL